MRRTYTGITTSMSPECKKSWHNYIRSKNFCDMVKSSKLLNRAQKQRIWRQATSGDLEGAQAEYRAILRGMGFSAR